MHLKQTIQTWTTALSRNGHVQAWIILNRGAWDQLQAEKTITCPRAFADEDFVSAYAWLRSRMEHSGLPAPGEGLTPWWCWVQREGDHPMPFREDIESMDQPVVLELLLPVHVLAVSCFDAWHWVLNNLYVHRSVEDERNFENAQNLGVSEVQLQRMKESSWDRIFDLGELFGTPTSLTERSLQGCFWELKMAHVVSVIETLDGFPNEDDGSDL